jgi:hypothetical protein
MVCKNVLDLACMHYNCEPEQLNDQIRRDIDREKVLGSSFVNTYKSKKIKS